VAQGEGSAGRTRGVALFCLLAALVLIGHALILGLHFEDTPRALADAAEGRRVGYTAAAGAVAALVALVGARRRWGLVAAALAVALVVVALVVDVT
jgi:hypothetical protein